MEIGLTPWASDGAGVESLHDRFLDQVELVEDLGFHSFWLPESHFLESGAFPAPLLLLAAAAARSQKLRLGTTSYLLPSRHPLHVAEEVGVLEQISGGRVILGVGRGFRPALFEAFDVPPSEKRDRFERALEAILQAWRGEPVAGSSATRVAPLPRQHPHPPIWVAAFGPKALAQAGRLNLPYLASPIEPLARLVANYERHARARPEGATERLPVPVIRTVFVTRDDALAGRVRSALTSQARGLAARLPAVAAELGELDVDDWALVGDPEHVGELVLRYRDSIGLTHMIARVAIPGLGPAELEDSVRLLAELKEQLR